MLGLLALTLTVAAGACYSGGQSAFSEGDSGDGDGGDGDGDGYGDVDCDVPAVIAAPMRRLNDVQYEHTIGDLFGATVTVSEEFPTTPIFHDFSNYADNNEVTAALTAEKILIASEHVAEQIVDDYAAQTGCTEGDSACAESYLLDLAARAYRRPLTQGERDHLTDFFATAQSDAESVEDGVGLTVEVILQMPQFLYLVEIGESEQDGIVRLTDYEIASRLSYLLIDGPPDQQLLSAAANGELHDAAVLEEHAWRIILDEPERAQAALGRFVSEWLEVSKVSSQAKDEDLFPEFTPAMAASFAHEVPNLVGEMGWNQNASMAELFTTQMGVVDGELAALYGVEAPNGETAVVDLGPDRIGLLSRAAFAAAKSGATESSALGRGLAVRTRLMCDTIGSPPAGATNEVEFPPDATQREKSEIMEAHEGGCWSCHQFMNPIGLGLESYGPIGNLRPEIDDTGTFVPAGDGVSGDFEGAAQLQQILVDGGEIQSCSVEQFVHHAYGKRDLDGQDQCLSQQIFDSTDGGQVPMLDLVVAFVASESFTQRRITE